MKKKIIATIILMVMIIALFSSTFAVAAEYYSNWTK